MTLEQRLDRIKLCVEHATVESPCSVCNGTGVVFGPDWCDACCCGTDVQMAVSEDEALEHIEAIRQALAQAVQHDTR